MKNRILTVAILSALMLTACANATDTTETQTTTATTVAETTTQETTTQETTTQETTVETPQETEVETTEEKIEPPQLTEEELAELAKKSTVDLKSINADTDLFALTNMEKLPVSDEPYYADLDGDGVDEEIRVGLKPFYDTDYIVYRENQLTFSINGVDYNLDPDLYPLSDSEAVYLCDIDSSDSYREIAFVPVCMTNDFFTNFYRYENDTLVYMFDLYYDTPDGEGERNQFFNDMNYVLGQPIITDGTGIITTTIRLSSQTWLTYCHYAFDSENCSLTLIPEEVYPYYYENIDNFEAAMEKCAEVFDRENFEPTYSTEDITVYAQRDENSESAIITPQNVIPTAEYIVPADSYWSECVWIYLVAEDGTSGWAKFEEIQLENLVMYD